MAVAVLVAACSAPTALPPECVAAPGSATTIAEGLTVRGGGTLRDAYAVALPASYDFEYVVAAEIDGVGLEGDGHIGTWATGPLGGRRIFAANAVAQEYSKWAAEANAGSPIDLGRDLVATSAEAVIAEACAAGGDSASNRHREYYRTNVRFVVRSWH
jgi:hypothetical protein